MVVRAVCALAPLASALLWSGCSPYGGGTFHCTADEQCTGGADGKCELDGLCSFADDTCPAPHRRYGELAGTSSNQCVGGMQIDGGMSIDTPDVPPPDSLACYGTGIEHVCFNAPPTGTITINTAINTDTSTMCDQAASTTECVIAANQITVQGTVVATGSKPLVLIAATTISVTGTLDVSSHRGGATGAGADGAQCKAPTAPTGRGGGAGGSFGGLGGNGGNGANGGQAAGTVTPTTLQGGCAGQAGIGNTTPGNGGGAMYLIAGTSITVTGQLLANGAGGNGATATNGGGGGGSGGFIGLEAPSVDVDIAIANGGGGGEGSSSGTGDPGDDAAGPGAAAGGTNGSGNGGDGGNGSAGANLNGAVGKNGTQASNDGGGGGGGGAGIIRVIPSSGTIATSSPPKS